MQHVSTDYNLIISWRMVIINLLYKDTPFNYQVRKYMDRTTVFKL